MLDWLAAHGPPAALQRRAASGERRVALSLAGAPISCARAGPLVRVPQIPAARAAQVPPARPAGMLLCKNKRAHNKQIRLIIQSNWRARGHLLHLLRRPA